MSIRFSPEYSDPYKIANNNSGFASLEVPNTQNTINSKNPESDNQPDSSSFFEDFTALETLTAQLNQIKSTQKLPERNYQPSHSCFFENFEIDPYFESKKIEELRLRLEKQFLSESNPDLSQ
jgi:hypothetical protein